MCGTGVAITIGFFWFVVAPVMVIVLSVTGNWFISRSNFRTGRLIPRIFWTFGSVAIAALTAQGLSDVQVKRFEQYCAKERAKNAAERANIFSHFWTGFSAISDDLYNAKNDQAPVMPKLRSLTDQVYVGVVKVGPIHKDGRRELSFSSASPSLLSALPKDIAVKWIVGDGYAPPSNAVESLYVTVDGETREASESEYSLNVMRRGKLVDVYIYTDYPAISVEPAHSTQSFVKANIGAEAYARYLGTTKLLPRKYAPTKCASGNNLQKAFNSVLTVEERNELNSTVTSKPCIVDAASARTL